MMVPFASFSFRLRHGGVRKTFAGFIFAPFAPFASSARVCVKEKHIHRQSVITRARIAKTTKMTQMAQMLLQVFVFIGFAICVMPYGQMKMTQTEVPS